MIMNIQSPGIVSLFNHFQEYLGIFRGVDPYLTRGKRGDPFLPILKIEKSVLILKRKALILSILGLNDPFKM